MRLENTMLSNYKLVIDEFDIPVAVEVDGEVRYRLYDFVSVTDDGCGYICSGIYEEGFGRIMQIRRDDTDHFFGVLMMSGEFGFMKDSRIEVVHKNWRYQAKKKGGLFLPPSFIVLIFCCYFSLLYVYFIKINI